MKRIHIIGGPGSGKSYAAQKLSERLNCETLDLDAIYWDKNVERDWIHADESDRDRELLEFVAKNSWVVEGSYYRWLEPSFKLADRIYVLKPSVWLRDVRIIRRFFRRKFGLEKSKREGFRNNIELLQWNHGYDGDNLERALNFIERHREKVVHVSSADLILEDF